MRRLLISVLTVVSAITSAAKSDAFAKIDVYQLIERADQFTLYSVDPTPPESLPPEKKKTEIERFHGYVVLGRIDAESSKMKERIRKTLTATFTDMYDGPPMLCFEPRLGVRLVSGGRQMDILLSFQCLGSAFYLEGDENLGSLAAKAEADFIAMLDEHGIARDIPKETKKRANQMPEPMSVLRTAMAHH